jgi:hypothetical protein
MAINVTAVKATELLSKGRESRNARKAASQIVRIGERNLSSTLEEVGLLRWLVSMCLEGIKEDKVL